MGSTTPLLDILSAHLPTGISSAEISSLNASQLRSTVETLLSFAVGAECPTRLPDARQDWSLKQPVAIKALQDFLGPKGSKRARESEESDDSSSKRQKTTETDADDPPLFTLPSISTTSPLRKKVDITIHERSLRFINTGTRAVEASIPIASISRAFLIPTRGKSKGHWTVVLLPTDVPDKGKALAPSSQQVIFGLDALSTSKFETTSYSSGASTPTSTTTVAKGEATVTSIRKLLSHLPVPLLEPSTTIFRSACATAKSGDGAAGVDAHLSAKSGTLWFFDSGILWGESKPCEFWAVSDLVAKDGVRLISATGRTCSVILSRKGGESKDVSKGGDGEEDGDEGEDIIETEFTAIDGREQDPIHAWARNRKHLFGKSSTSPPSTSDTKQQAKSSGKETSKGPLPGSTVKGPAWDDSDSDDDDFEAASSEDLHSDSSDSEDSEDAGGSDEENGSQSEGAEESGDDQSEVEELSEAHHPLLRPGAMPRMSKAAIDAVVDMVQGDLEGDASDEEDELDE